MVIAYDIPFGDHANDVIRIFAYSPMLRMVSTGIYPMSTSLFLTSTSITTAMGYETVPRSERKIQVWISGAGSKWEEVREEYE